MLEREKGKNLVESCQAGGGRRAGSHSACPPSRHGRSENPAVQRKIPNLKLQRGNEREEKAGMSRATMQAQVCVKTNSWMNE